MHLGEAKVLDFKLVDEALVFVRRAVKKNEGNLPSWVKMEELIRDHLKDEYNPKPKVAKEYYYAYLREKGLSDEDARDRMGLAVDPPSVAPEKKSFWKFW